MAARLPPRGAEKPQASSPQRCRGALTFLALLVGSILLLLLVGGIIQAPRHSPLARGIGAAGHFQPFGGHKRPTGVGNGVWVRGATFSSWPSYLGDSLWSNSLARN